MSHAGGRKKVAYSEQRLRELWASGASYREIAAALGCSTHLVCDLKVRHGLPDRGRTSGDIPQDDPTPDEIQERAAAIREANLAKLREESDASSMSRGAHHRADCDWAIRRYTWDGFRFNCA